MKIFRLPVLVLFAYAFVLMGCGQKGPLYLPEKQTPPKIEAEPTASKVETNTQQTTKDEATQQTTESESSPAVSDGVNK